MPATPIHAITYPSGSVAPNVPLVMQQLAESVEAAFQNQKPSYASVNGTVSQSIPNAAWTKATFASTEAATTGTIDNGTGTITITNAGFYVIAATGGTAATTSGSFGIRIDNGATTLATALAGAGAAGSSGSVTAMAYLNVNEAISFSIYQSSGAARTTTATPRLALIRVAS